MRNRALVVKMAMPREMFPVATMLVSLYHVLPQIVILIAASLMSGWTPEAVDLVALVLGLLICGLLGLAGALFFSAANVFFSDFGNIVSVFNNFVRWGVPMMYSYAMVDDRFGRFAQYYLYNPLADASCSSSGRSGSARSTTRSTWRSPRCPSTCCSTVR